MLIGDFNILFSDKDIADTEDRLSSLNCTLLTSKGVSYMCAYVRVPTTTSTTTTTAPPTTTTTAPPTTTTTAQIINPGKAEIK